MKEDIQEALDRLGGIMTHVNVKATDDDIFHDFTGTIIGIHGDYIMVQDQDEQVFDCYPDQLTPNTDYIMHAWLKQNLW